MRLSNVGIFFTCIRSAWEDALLRPHGHKTTLSSVVGQDGVTMASW